MGLRRYQNKDGTLTQLGKEHYSISTGGNRALARKYDSEAKKLEKYRKQQDVDLQRKNAERYGKRANVAGKVRKIATAVAVPSLGVSALDKSGVLSDAANKAGKVASDIKFRSSGGSWTAAKTPYRAWLNSLDPNPNGKNYKLFRNAINTEVALKDANIKLGKIAPLAKAVGTASAAAAVGAGVTQAVYKIKQKAAEKRISEIGHKKARAKYEAQYHKMLNVFEGTPYADILKKQKI